MCLYPHCSLILLPETTLAEHLQAHFEEFPQTDLAPTSEKGAPLTNGHNRALNNLALPASNSSHASGNRAHAFAQLMTTSSSTAPGSRLRNHQPPGMHHPPVVAPHRAANTNTNTGPTRIPCPVLGCRRINARGFLLREELADHLCEKHRGLDVQAAVREAFGK